MSFRQILLAHSQYSAIYSSIQKERDQSIINILHYVFDQNKKQTK